MIGAFPRAVSRMAARGCTYSIYAARRVLTVGDVREKQRPSMPDGEEGIPDAEELHG